MIAEFLDVTDSVGDRARRSQPAFAEPLWLSVPSKRHEHQRETVVWSFLAWSAGRGGSRSGGNSAGADRLCAFCVHYRADLWPRHPWVVGGRGDPGAVQQLW